MQGGVHAGDLEPSRRRPGDQVRVSALTQDGAELGPHSEELHQRVTRRELQPFGRGLGYEVPDALLLTIEERRIQIQLSVRPLVRGHELETTIQLSCETALRASALALPGLLQDKKLWHVQSRRR